MNRNIFYIIIILIISCEKKDFITDRKFGIEEITQWELLTDETKVYATKHIPDLGVIPWYGVSNMRKFYAVNPQGDTVANEYLLTFTTRYFDTVDKVYYNSELINIFLPNYKLLKPNLKYKIKSDSYALFSTKLYGLLAHGDVLTRGYETNPYYENYIIFTDIDTNKKILKGLFELHFKLQYPIGGYNNDLFLENGRFEVNYIE